MASQPPEFVRRRQQCPVSHVTLPTGDPALLVLKHQDIEAIMGDDRRFTRDLSDPSAPRLFPNILVLEDPELMMNMHGDDHLRLRRIIASAFTPRRAEKWRDEVRAIVDELLDDVERMGPPVDLMANFAYRLPTRMVCRLLGISDDEGDRTLGWVAAWLSVDAIPVEERDKAAAEFTAWAVALIEERRANPQDALLDHLISARDVDDRLTEGELVSMLRGLIIGGNETIANAISRSVLSLMRFPERWEELLANRDLIPKAVEELLRFSPPGGGASGLLRLATEDVELPSGAGTVRKGQAVLTPLVAAGHDPEAFPDPEELRFDREGKTSTMQFGAGRHFCPGVHLARVELQTVLAALLDRFPKLHLPVEPEELPWSEGSYGTSLLGLPVAW
ncbi:MULTISPECIES: cytochrome P450 [Streptomyces]|uniref:cytochrome P450 n=1 Tax=Streptomyces TaxID=1883 RepID=UPI00186AD59A|nr:MULTISPECIES: cytochrome P450 [Streptomyces]